MPEVEFDSIPSELEDLRQWVNWRYETRDGKRTKVPYSPSGRRADTTDPKTWSTFAECVAARCQFDGIGIVCANGLAGIDLDHCIDDNGNLSDLARHVVSEMQTYTEITPSGLGLRCLCFGKLPDGSRRKDGLGIEMYDGARYFTVTGNRLPNTPATIEHRDTELARLHAEIFGTDTRDASRHALQTKAHRTPVSLDDRQIIEKAMAAKNGDAFTRLWNGDTAGHNGNHSDADLALCSSLAFWTGGDAVRMDRFFRESGLMRPKWDERHSARGETYGQMTIAKAVASVYKLYSPSFEANGNGSEQHLAMGAPVPTAPHAQHPLSMEEQIAALEQMVDAIPTDTDKVRLSIPLHPILEALAKLDKAIGAIFLLRKVKEHFGLTRVEMTALESDLVKLRKDWERAEVERRVKEAAAAQAQSAKPKEMSDAERAEAMEFLKDPRIIMRVVNDITDLGYVGEEASKAILYLVATSRKQDNPLSAVSKSPSSYGKSDMIKKVATLIPPEDVLEFTRVTAQALAYMPPNALKHKLLILVERNGSEASDYNIRTMQSEQVIRIAYTVKDPDTGEMHTAEREVNGPMAYIETTTRPMIHSENATRVFEVYLDGSEQQTQKIHEAQRKSATLAGLRKNKEREAIIRRHQNAQRLLLPIMVVIPYADYINFPASNPRTRRDFPRFLELIKVVAFLRQYQKKRKIDVDPYTGESLEYIEADLADYEIPYRYAAPVIASGLDELPKHSRELFEKIVVMVKDKIESKDGKKQFTRQDIRRLCGATDKFVKDYVVPLEDKEYLEIIAGGKGKKYIYELPDSVPTEPNESAVVKGLTTPAELEEMLRLAGMG